MNAPVQLVEQGIRGLRGVSDEPEANRALATDRQRIRVALNDHRVAKHPTLHRRPLAQARAECEDEVGVADEPLGNLARVSAAHAAGRRDGRRFGAPMSHRRS
jgi:hypothetical protein